MRLVLRLLVIAVVFSSAASAAEKSGPNAERDANRAWLAAQPAAPKPELTRHGLVAEELRRWKARGANQGVAVDARYFYGIGNYVVGKYDKATGQRVAEWVGLRGGAITHLNSGLIQDGQLILAHSNFPQIPMASSVEFFDPATVQPVKSFSLGIRHGSLTWAEKKDGFWWACFAHYSSPGAAPGASNRFTIVGRFNADWQMLESWLFPPQVIASWGPNSSSGGSWGDDGLLYTTGHDARELHVLRLPRTGVTLEYVTTIDVPFEGQAWAWDRGEGRIIYGITRSSGEVVVARIPPIPANLLAR
jgi:hypothetical protein